MSAPGRLIITTLNGAPGASAIAPVSPVSSLPEDSSSLLTVVFLLRLEAQPDPSTFHPYLISSHDQ